MWKLDRVAVRYQTRPSQIVGIEGSWEAYCLDSAVALFGSWVEAKLRERTNLGYPKHDLAKLLQFKTGRSHDPGDFADVSRLMKLQEKG